MAKPVRCLVALVATLLALSSASDARAQSSDVPPPAALQERIAAVEAEAESPARDELLANLRATLENVQATERAQRDAAAFRRAIESAPADVAETRALIRAHAALATPPLPDGVEALQNARRTAQAERDALQADLQNLRGTMALREQRRIDVPRALNDVTARHQSLVAPTPDELTGLADDAQREVRLWRHASFDARLMHEIEALKAEERNLKSEAVSELLTARVELATRRLEARDRELATIGERLEAARRTAAESAEAEAKARASAARNDHPLIALLTRWNAEFASEATVRVERLARAEENARQLGATRERLERDFRDMRSRIEVVGGLTDSIGQVLRQKRRELQRVLRDNSRAIEAGERLGELQLRWFELEQKLRILERDLPPLETLDELGAFASNEWTNGDVPALAPSEFAAIQPRVRELLDESKQQIRDLRAATSRLTDAMARVVAESATLQAYARESKAFVDENILWLRSTTPIWEPELGAAAAAWGWLVAPDSWASVVDALRGDFEENPWPISLLALFVLVLTLAGNWARRVVSQLGERAADGANATFGLTIAALVCTTIAALPIPILLLVLGSRLESTSEQGSFPFSFGNGLTAVGWLTLTAIFARQVTRSNGLAHKHFRWPVNVSRALRRGLTWSIPIAGPLTLALTTLRSSGNDLWSQAGGRPALLVILLVLAVLLWRLLHPRAGVVAQIRADRAGVYARWNHAWTALGVGIPTILIGLSCAGFQFTAVELTLRLLATVGLVFGLLIVYSLVLRALALARRDLALARAKEAAEKETPQDTASPAELGEIGQQTRALIHGMFGLVLLIGSWMLWVDVVPALGVFREVVLWSETVDGELSSVTLASFLLATVYATITLLAARNIPGVLELTILQRFSMHQGERHAIKTIARYVILAIGFTSAFSAIGIGWSKAQWLIAALGVGLGFGLQEIFANFVSGIIILLEQPVRVGDLVTVSDTDGYVTQIRMRATVVTDYDRKELIIPNKEFITGRVVNWSLTDPVVRVVIKVGVAYGTDADLVRRTLLDVAAKSPVALSTPRPKALFVNFGDSTLDFQLRVFIPTMDEWPRLMNDINTRIQRRFAEEDIEIAFPQRDLHIRSAPGLTAFAEQIGGRRTPPSAAS